MTLKSKSIPFLAAGLCILTIATFGLISGKASVSPATRTAGIGHLQATTRSVDVLPMLPVVKVVAQAPIPELPRVIVRASTAERMAAEEHKRDDDSVIIANSSSGDGNDSLPHVNLDMPYYSFGKVLPRISKE